MADINQVILVGRLVRDIDVGYSKTSNFPIGKFTIAINRRRKNGDNWVDEANYFDVTLMGTIAEKLKPYLTKGKQVGVEGNLVQDRWEKDEQKFSKVSIMANNVMLLGGNSGGSQGYAPSNSSDYNQGGYSQGGYTNQNFGNDGNFGGQNFNSAPNESMYYGGDNSSISDDVPF